MTAAPDPHLPTHDLPERIERALAMIRARSAAAPAVAITLGSGLGRFADALEQAVAFPTASIPEWPPSTVAGHSGRLVLGTWKETPLVVLAGRSHRYEGYTADRITFGVRVMHALGARTMIFTNAVGAVNPNLSPGDLVLASDHINAVVKRGLLTPAELVERRGGRPVGSFYDGELAAALAHAATRAGVPLRRGVLMAGTGPAYETAAEIGMARAMGADMVCMSTVHEVTVAAHLGCRVAGLSCVTNRATGLSPHKLSHDEVTEVAHRVSDRLTALFGEWLSGVAT